MSKNLLLDNPLDRLKEIAQPTEYRDGFHLGLNQKNYPEYFLSIEKEFGEEIYKRVLEKKPSIVLELGTANGYSACWFLLGLNENFKGMIITVDHEDRQPKIWDVLGLDKKRLVYENKESSEFLNTFGKGLDMVFLDTHHQIENVISDFEKILPKLNEGADIFIHDTNANPEMGKQLREYLDGTKLYSHESIDKSCGLMIATYKGVPNV